MSRSKPAPRSIIAWVFLVGLIIAFGLVIPAGLIISVWPMGPPRHTGATPSVDGPHDRIDQRQTKASPDGSHIAIAQWTEDDWFLGGRRDFEIWIGKSSAPRATLQLAFSSNDHSEAAWVDERHLMITVGAPNVPFYLPEIPSIPTVMVRSVGDVTISYRLADRLLEMAYHRSIEQVEQRSCEIAQRPPDPFAQGPIDDPDKNNVAYWEFAQRLWAKYLEFQGWASANTENALSGPAVPNKPEFDFDEAFPSPDGSNIATMVPNHTDQTPIGIASYEVRVGKRDDPRSGDITVFAGLDEMPDIAWTDANHLVLTLNCVARVRASLHKAGDITVSYRIPDYMREDPFRARLDHWKQGVEDNERKKKRLSPEALAKHLAELDRDVQQQRVGYGKFHDWVETDVEAGSR